MERLYGDAFDITQVMDQTSKSYNTYITAVGTYRACWANRKKLTYTHHKEAFYSKLDVDQRNWVLDTSERLGLTVLAQRKLISHVRHYGTEGLQENMPADGGELLERVEVRGVNKNYMFFLPVENKWFTYRGPFEHIPNGADPILNADTRAKLARDGTPEVLSAWIPAGVEVPVLRGHSATIEAQIEEAAPVDAPVRRSRGGNRHVTPVVIDPTPIEEAPEPEAVEATQVEQLMEAEEDYTLRA